MQNLQLTLLQARLSWWRRQRLGSCDSSAVQFSDVLLDVGAIPLATRAAVPLALYARGVPITRSELHGFASKNTDCFVVPGPRGSSYLSSSADALVYRSFAVADIASREARIAAGTNLHLRELEETRITLRTLLRQPLTSAQLVAQLPPIALRSLGSVGQRNGALTVAALVLKQLWACGEVMQLVGDDWMSESSVRWQLDPSPRVIPTAADAIVPAAQIWLKSLVPVPLRVFAKAFDLSVGRAKSAFETLGSLCVTVDGVDDLFYLSDTYSLEQELDSAAQSPVQFLPIRDPLTDLLHPLLLPVGVSEKSVQSKKHGVSALVLYHGSVIGTWAYDDTVSRVLVQYLVQDVSTKLQDAVQEHGQKLATYLLRQWPVVPLHGVYIPRAKPASAFGMLL